MSKPPRKIAVCSCEDTMVLDGKAIAAACKGAEVTTARHLCRSQRETFSKLAGSLGALTIACTQEQALFQELAADAKLPAALTFANIRETAGWSTEGADAAPKMAALLAAAEIIDEPHAIVSYESEGVTLILGRDAVALDAAEQLKNKLDITVVLLPGADVVPPRASVYPVRQGRVRSAKGHLGAFEITLDKFAAPAASSRAKLLFGKTQDGAVSKADLILDLTGGAALFPASDLRAGYLRADPGNPADVQKQVLAAADLVGTFDKPRYVNFSENLCAHSRSKKTGCTRCLDLCPAGAIQPNGNVVAIDPYICAGCGQCAAACPTGAAAYAFPAVDTLLARLRALLTTYRTAGGKDAQILFYDREHGDVLIDAAARFGDGLPARTLPVAVNEVTQIGLETLAAAFAYGASSVQILTRAKPKHDIAGLKQTLATSDVLLSALGFGAGLVGTIEADDPDAFVAALRSAARGTVARQPSSFSATGGKRDILKTALRELHRAAPRPIDVVALPKGSVFGTLDIKADGCTLCLSCVSACPTRALGDAKDQPLLSFDESLCVQCGLCQATCPETVISLKPQLDFRAFEAGRKTIKQEEPFCCISCGKAFGVKSTIEKIVAKLEVKHWMFQGDNKSRLDLVKMCDTCRVEKVVNAGLDPFAGPARAPAKTSDDYFREREAKAADADAREKSMLDKIKRGDA